MMKAFLYTIGFTMPMVGILIFSAKSNAYQHEAEKRGEESRVKDEEISYLKEELRQYAKDLEVCRSYNDGFAEGRYGGIRHAVETCDERFDRMLDACRESCEGVPICWD